MFYLYTVYCMYNQVCVYALFIALWPMWKKMFVFLPNHFVFHGENGVDLSIFRQESLLLLSVFVWDTVLCDNWFVNVGLLYSSDGQWDPVDY